MKNKKGITVMTAFVSTVISLLIFFLLFTYMKTTSSTIVTESDDLLCRALVSSKDFTKLGLGFYLYEINQKCKVDEIKNIDLSEKEESFRKIADAMHRCWFRYGEGKHDFLSEWDTTGKWCFECGKISFDKNDAAYSFEEFLEWTKKSKPKGKNITYFEIISIRYGDVNDSQIDELREEYRNLLEEGNDEFTAPMFNLLGQQIEDLQDLKIKTIDSSDNMFVVYRFDRVDKNFEDKMKSAALYAAGGTAIAIGGGIALEFMAEAMAGAAMGAAGGALLGGVTAVPGAIIGFVVGAARGAWKAANAIYDGAKLIKKMDKISDLIRKTKGFVKISNKAHLDDLSDIKKVDLVLGAKKFKVYEKAMKFDASPKDLKSLANGIRQTDPITASKFDSLSNFMDAMGVKNLKEIDSKVIQGKSSMAEYQKLLDSTEGLVSDNVISNLRSQGIKVEQLEGLRSLAQNELAELAAGRDVKLSATPYLLKIGVIAGTGAAVGYLKESYFNDNNVQYVDLLTQEQYYRMCGTERMIS